MGRRSRRVRDDLIDMALDAVRNGTIGRPGEEAKDIDWETRQRLREQEKERRRLEYQRRSQRSVIAVGGGLLVGGLVGATGIFPLVAVGAGIITYGATAWTLRKIAEADLAPRLARPKSRPEIAAPRVDESGLNDARAQLVRKVLDDATSDLKKLDAAASRLADAEAREIAARLVSAGQRLSGQVAQAPEKLSMAQRAFTYHLPKAVYVAESIGALEASGADPARRQAARHVLARMENLFEKTALDLAGVDAREMDVELRLIQQALDEDLNERRR
jgi:5-bromo-4-chloroindolyl phosphate hydrolysis protein